jgi:hypothetical protein
MQASKVVLVALSALTLSACVVAPYPPPPRQVVYAEQPIAVADIPPPAPYQEVITPVPFAGAVWIGGYWGWAGGRHQWVPGRWEAPRPGYAWAPHRWVPVNGRWHLTGGAWVRR